MNNKEENCINELKPQETCRIMKNVVLISVAFMIHFTAYNGAANLQSSINAEAGLGTASLAAVYAGLIFSNIFLPLPVIKAIGTKWTISLAFVTYMPYIGAQLYPRFYTMIPAGLILGMGGGPLWCAKCTYISVVSESHSSISKISAEALIVRFLGLFFMIFQMNQVWGNLISSLVLSSGENSAAETSLNATMIPQLCGSNFLPSADAHEALPPQPQEKIRMLSGIYLVCMAGAAFIVAIGVDPMTRAAERSPCIVFPSFFLRYWVFKAELKEISEYGGMINATTVGYTRKANSEADRSSSGLALLALTLKLLIEPKPLLLVTINIFIGIQQAFFGADFTAAFVSCSVGTGSVGFVMMAYGLSDAIGCVVTGYIAKITGRFPLILTAMILDTCLFITILVWKPQAGMSYVLYIIAVLWGICDSIWLVQINAFYGILFPGREEAAFSNFRLWESVGYIIAYVISPYLRTKYKTYLMLILMITGFCGYFVVECQDRRRKKCLPNENKLVLDVIGRDNVAFQNTEL